ncbi:MAG: YbjN domain-containing protein [Desulfovibrionaceae bacterium]|nr:YbjN domain-containing protein [Desulfovibrionaceae bacterium]
MLIFKKNILCCIAIAFTCFFPQALQADPGKSEYKDQFTSLLHKKEIVYTNLKGNNVSVAYTLNDKPVSIRIAFNENGDGYVSLYCFDLAKNIKDTSKIIPACNEINAQYKWVKFYVDKDNDLVASFNAKIDKETGADECLEILLRMCNIIKEAYPVLMKGI